VDAPKFKALTGKNLSGLFIFALRIKKAERTQLFFTPMDFLF